MDPGNVPPINRELLLEQGWRQGCLLSREQLDGLNLWQGEAGIEYGIVATQTCDLLDESLIREPILEIIPAQVIKDAEGNYKFGKNSRTLDATFLLGQGEILLRCFSRKCCAIERQKINELGAPAGHISDELTVTFRKWLGKRYNRPALPDALQPRLNDVFSDTVRRRIKRQAESIAAVLLRFHPSGELTSKDEYQVEILFLMHGEHYANPDSLQAVEEISQLVDGRITLADGLIQFPNSLFVQSTHEMTIEEFAYFSQFDFDDLSPDDEEL